MMAKIYSYSITQVAKIIKQSPYMYMRFNWMINQEPFMLNLPGLLIQDLPRDYADQLWNHVWPKFKSTYLHDQVPMLVEQVMSKLREVEQKKIKVAAHQWEFENIPPANPYYKGDKIPVIKSLATNPSLPNAVFNAAYIQLVQKLHPGCACYVQNSGPKTHRYTFFVKDSKTVAAVLPLVRT